MTSIFFNIWCHFFSFFYKFLPQFIFTHRTILLYALSSLETKKKKIYYRYSSFSCSRAQHFLFTLICCPTAAITIIIPTHQYWYFIIVTDFVLFVLLYAAISYFPIYLCFFSIKHLSFYHLQSKLRFPSFHASVYLSCVFATLTVCSIHIYLYFIYIAIDIILFFFLSILFVVICYCC